MLNNRLKIGKIAYYGLHLVGLVLLIYVLRGLNFNDLFAELKSYDPFTISFCFMILIVIYLLKSFRWYRIVKALDGNLSYVNAVQYYVIAVFFSILTPGRVGEFVKIYFIRKNKILNTTDAWVSSIIDRLFDVIVLGVVGLISVLYYVDINKSSVAAILIVVVFISSVILFFFPETYKALVFGIFKKYKYRRSLIVFTNSITRTRNGAAMSLLLSMASLGLLATIPVIVASSSDFEVGISTSLATVSISNILSFLPITIAGFGTRELVFTFFWERLSYPKYIALSVSTVYFVVVYVGSLLIGAIIYLTKFYKKIDLKKIKDERNY